MRDHVDHYGYPVGPGERGWSSAERERVTHKDYGRRDAGLEGGRPLGDTENRTDPAEGFIRQTDAQKEPK